MNTIRVRMAPSPTGVLHIGTVRTCLFNYLFAKKNGGTFIIRIEDTDPLRSTKEFEENIITGLRDLGLEADEDPFKGGPYKPYRQSERKETYKPYLEQLLTTGKAYYCYCSKDELEQVHTEQVAKKQAPRYPGTCRHLSAEEKVKKEAAGIAPVIRLAVPTNITTQFVDLIRGKVAQSSNELDDFIIARNLESPLYNFVVVIDDHLMKISHVLRGEDHIANTFKQILIYQAIGADIPYFAHLPLILNADKTKLSKRKNKVSVSDYLADGFLPEAIINFLALLGWNPGNNVEIMTIDSIIEAFTLEKVQKSGAVFDTTKFLWINSQHIKNLPFEEFAKRSQGFLGKYQELDSVRLEKALILVQERCKKLSELPELLSAVLDENAYEVALLQGKGLTVEIVRAALEIAENVITKLDSEPMTLANRLEKCEQLKTQFIELIAAQGLKNGDVLWPTRAALSGQQSSPGAFEMIWFLGKDEALKRLQIAKQKLTA